MFCIKLNPRSGGQDGRLDRHPIFTRFINLCKQLVLLNTYYVSMFTRHKRQSNSVQSKPSLKRYKQKIGEARERVSSQNELTLCCSPRFFDLFGVMLFSKDRCSFDSFDSLYCHQGLANLSLVNDQQH